MSRITKHTIGNTDYTFFNETWERGNAWGHRTVLHQNVANSAIHGVEIADVKTQYFNRTWESYCYQSVMRMAVEVALDELVQKAIIEYKAEHNIKRMVASRRNEVLKAFENHDLRKLYKML